MPRSFAHPIFNGELHSGFAVELHETELPAGEVPHPPHHHAHEEVILVREGTMEVTISGRSVKMGPGSVAFVASNEDHGWPECRHNHGALLSVCSGTRLELSSEPQRRSALVQGQKWRDSRAGPLAAPVFRRVRRRIPSKIDAGSKCASLSTSDSRPPVSHWLFQSDVSE
jgi:mannose-6-phosphate isomerase-like protein (cupin superfamily)